MAYTGSEPFNPKIGGTGVANASTSTLTLGGALSTVGSFTSSFTMTGNTSVTFPTSGTLATTSQIPSITTTQNATLIGGAGNTISSLTVAGNGQLVIGRSGLSPVVANITSTGNTVTITNGSGTINLEVAGGTAITTLNGNTGSATGSTVTITGVATGLTFTGAASTLSLGGILVPSNGGTGVANTGTITLAGNLITAGTGNLTLNTTATTSVTLPISGTLATTSQIPSVTATNNSLLVGAGGTTIASLGLATNGQIPIGSTGSSPVLANITSSGGTISITNGAGSINIEAVTTMTWSSQTIGFSAAASNGYFCLGTFTATLPTITVNGTSIMFVVRSAGGLTVAGAGGNTIQIGNQNSSAVLSLLKGDALTLVSCAVDNIWYARDVVGNWNP